MAITDLIVRPTERQAKTFAADAGARLRLTAQDLLGSLLTIRGRAKPGRGPKVQIRISVYRPDGRSAVAIRLGSPKS